MPFLSYQTSTEKAVENAGRLLKEGRAECVKLEGGRTVAETTRNLVDSGIPVMAHLGLTPQSVHQFGGYGVRGVQAEESQRLLEDAKLLEDAGACSLVLEKIPADLAQKVSEELEIPTIGIGAGPHCDGQVLVTHDMLGLFDKFAPKFVRKYADLAEEIRDACGRFKDDVKKGKFPDSEESY
jgi:3-methyl-2-oxobutanoate hydroxymethyltransferase